jgi:gliding motility-associated-like protein
VETTPESGKLNYSITDTDSDGVYNYTELDSDNDSCSDVIEAGFTDRNNDHFLGSVSPPTVNKSGIVTSGIGYTVPNLNYTIAAPIIIDKQPENKSVCELQNTVFTITAASVTGYQWQVSRNNGAIWTDLVNNVTYSGVNSASLTVSDVLKSMNTYQYRVFLSRTGNSCGLHSDATTLTILALPVINSPITLVQCDDDTDGVSTFNLTQKNNGISLNSALESFSYYTTKAAAESKDSSLLIANSLAYNTSDKTIYVRIENANGCFSVSQLNLVVSVTQIPNSFKIGDYKACDDFVNGISTDTDGISGFDFSNVTQQIKNTLPASASNYTVSYYKNETDFLAETDALGNSLEITDISNYRNTGYPNNQKIWARVENSLSNDCFGFTTFNLIVNPFPSIDLNTDGLENEIVCNNLPEFMVKLEAGINDGTPINDYGYQWYLNGAVISGATTYAIEVNKEGIYSVEVKNTNNCSRTRTVKVVASNIADITAVKVKDLSEYNSVSIDVAGPGEYVYSITDSNGPYQDSNLFENVSVGFHTVYIKDLNGCGIAEKEIAVLGVPKFFTPNGDRHNDVWKVEGVNADFFSKSIIYIFDRYGKMITQFSGLGSGWDGTFQGTPLPADDYWYTAKFEDGREAKGHFTLKR